MACGNLGVANDFNFFVLGDHRQSNNSSEGRIAVGGNVVYRNYGIGNRLPVSQTRNDLIVAGSVDIMQGSNFSGNTIISPGSTIINYTMTNNNGVRPQPLRGTPIDFAAAEQYLTCASASWAAVPANGSASNYYGQIRLTGTSPTLNVFTIDGANVTAGVSLSSANGVNFLVPQNSTILVNVAGDNVGFGSYSIFINGNTASQSAGARILWNFYQARTAFNLNLSIKGSVLAPKALWSPGGYGNIDGTLAVRSFIASSGNLAGQNVPFTGCLPEVFCSPALTLTKTVNGAAAASGPAGTPLRYEIVARNTGAGLLANVQLSDPLIGFAQTVPSLPAGEEVRFSVNSQIRSGAPGETYTNTATAASSLTASQTASVTVTIEGVLDVEFVKTADRLSAKPGETVNYQFAVNNNGSLPLQNLCLTDTALGIDRQFDSFFAGTLLTVSYVIPQNAEAGKVISNTATLSASNLPASLNSKADILVEDIPSVSLVKSADRSVALPGETVAYTIRVSNDSQITTLSNLLLTDQLLGLSQIINTLAARSSLVFNGTYLVPEGTAAGTVITNTSVLQSSLGQRTASSSVTVGVQPILTLAKTPTARTFAPGERAVYNLTVSNTGNIPLHNVVVSDQDQSFQASIPELAAGSSQSYIATSQIGLQSASGTIITNTASAASNETGTVTATAEITVAPFFSLQLQKNISALTAAPGERITYTILLTNASNAAVTGIVLADAGLGLDQRIERMERNGMVMFEIPFTIPEGTLAGTVIRNTVTAVSNETPEIISDAELTVAPAPELSFTKSVDTQTALPGQIITYSFIIINTGNMELTGLVVTDPALGIRQEAEALAPGQVWTFQSAFTVPLLPPNSILLNTATAAADQLEEPVEGSAAVNIGATPLPLLVKTSSVTEASPEESIQFQIVLTNTAPVPLTNVRLADSLLELTDVLPVLQPGDSRQFLLQYTIPADAAGGTVIVNEVTVLSDQTPFQTSAVSVTVRSVPLLNVSKTTAISTVEQDQSVQFMIVLENEGNVDLTNVRIEDPFLSFLTVVPVLTRGTGLTLTLPYAISPETPPGTVLVNEAVVSSEQTPPVGAIAGVEVVARPVGDLELVKAVSPSQALPGSTVFYTITVHNPTQIPVTNIRLADAALGFDESLSLLRPDATSEFRLAYTVPGDAPAGLVIANTVGASADEGIIRSAVAELTVLASPRLVLSKTVTPDTAIPGETVTYTITASNTGNSTLTNVRVTDPVLGLDVTVPSLATGAQPFTVPFVIPALPAGSIIANIAAAFSDSTPQPVTAEASVSVGAAPALTLTKSVQPDTAGPGDTVRYLLTVANPNAFGLTNVELRDEALGYSERFPTLPEGASKTVEIPFRLADDLLPGTVVVNTAEAFSDETLSASAQATVLISERPALRLANMSDRTTANPGDEVRFMITVANTGNVTLTNVFLQDGLLEINEEIGLLQPRSNVMLNVPYRVPERALAGEQIFSNAVAGSNETSNQEAFASVTVAAVTSAVIVTVTDAETVVPGNPVTFTTTITNTSNQPLSGLQLSDTLLGLINTVPTLAVGETITLVTVYPVPLNARLDSSIVNIFTLLSNDTPLEKSQASVLVLPAAAVGLEKRFPAIGLQGENVPYTLLLSNAGNITLNRIDLQDALAGVSFQLLEFPYASFQTFRGFVPLAKETPIGTVLNNEARVQSVETGVITREVRLVVTGLSLSLSTVGTVAFVGDKIQYRIAISNPMGYTALQSVLSIRHTEQAAVFVPGSVFVGGVRQQGASPVPGIRLGAIAPGQLVTVAFELQAVRVPRGGKLANQAEIAYDVRFPDRTASGVSVSNEWTVDIFEDEE